MVMNAAEFKYNTKRKLDPKLRARDQLKNRNPKKYKQYRARYIEELTNDPSLKELHFKKRLLSRAKSRAIKAGYISNLTLDDIIIPSVCPLLGIALDLSVGQGPRTRSNASPSIDRIDNTKGYIKGNIKIISTLANAMKSSATEEQLLTFSRNIHGYIRGCL